MKKAGSTNVLHLHGEIMKCRDWLMKFAFTNPTFSKEIFLKKN